MRALKKGTITYSGTIPYVRLDDVQDILERLERICEMCGHGVHEIECDEPNGEYDHINGFHECGCPGPSKCEYDCSYCNGDSEDEIADWYDAHDAVTVVPFTFDDFPVITISERGIVKGHICTCLAPGMNYCEVHDGYGTEFDEYDPHRKGPE
jgi:hypothetical protein